jgi:broad specificity phosphatase PhoE
MSTVKTLILVRHAHRNTDDASRDNGLSDKGEEQVKKLIKFAKNRLEGTKPFILSSPKKRCQETIGPVAKELGIKLEIDNRLTEHAPGENSALYQARIDEFLNFWKYECPEVTIICSHGDWLPVAIQKLTGAKIGMKKSGWCEIEYIGGESFLTWIVQKHY